MMNRPPFVISIQSQVVFGHVGNSAAVFPMQAVGLQVAPIPTVLFSTHHILDTAWERPCHRTSSPTAARGANERGLADRSISFCCYLGSGELPG